MRVLLLLWVLVVSACAESDTQYVKSVKGGGNRYQEKVAEYWSRFNNTQRGESSRHEEVQHEEVGTGVCYIEVPTINLVQDPSNVPTGNGSRSDLSRIRSCCAGYMKNRHNPMICDPVCTKGCINSLCVAPETCKCYPDYIKNKGGFCIPTCPIGCPNGYCSGGECLCNSGYELDHDGKYCMPSCRGGCGSSGNCTAPDTCSCPSGLQSSPDGSCKPEGPKCDNCEFGQCIGHQTCICYPGYSQNPQGKCIPQCTNPCSPGSSCVAPNVCAPSTTGNETGQHYFMTPITTRPLYPASQVTNTPANNRYPDRTPSYPQNNGFYPNGTRRGPETSQYPQTNYGSYPVSPRPDGHSQPNPNKPRDDLGPYPNQNTQTINYGVYPYPQGPNQSGYSNRNRGDIETQTNQDTQTFYVPNLEPQRQGEHYPGSPFNQLPVNPQRSYNGQQNNTSYSQNYPYNQRPGDSVNEMSNSTPHYPNSRPTYPSVPGSYYTTEIPYNNHGHQMPNNPSRNPNNGYDQNTHQQGYPYPQQGSGTPLYPGNQQYGSQGYNQHNQGTYPNNYGTNVEYYYPNYPNPSGHTFEISNQVSNESRSHNQSNTFYARENRYNSQYPAEDEQSHKELEVPVCSLPCINGECVQGNKCICKQGYVPDRVDPNKCLPHCPGGCTNGVCTAPRMCLCNVGYHKDTSTKGRPLCIKRIEP